MGIKVFEDVIKVKSLKMRSSWIRVALNPLARVLKSGRRVEDTGGGQVTSEVETAGVATRSWKRPEGPSPRASGESMALWHFDSDFWPPELGDSIAAVLEPPRLPRFLGLLVSIRKLHGTPQHSGGPYNIHSADAQTPAVCPVLGHGDRMLGLSVLSFCPLAADQGRQDGGRGHTWHGQGGPGQRSGSCQPEGRCEHRPGRQNGRGSRAQEGKQGYVGGGGGWSRPL